MIVSHSSPREQATWVRSLKALLRTQQSSSDYPLTVAVPMCQAGSCMLGPKITLGWLSQRPAPESRPSQLQSCQQGLGILPTGTEHPTQATGTVPAEWGTTRSWRPAEPVHTYPIVSGRMEKLYLLRWTQSGHPPCSPGAVLGSLSKDCSGQEQLFRDIRAFPRVSCQLLLGGK